MVVAHVDVTSNLGKEEAKVLVGDPAILVPIEIYVVKMADMAVGQAQKPADSSGPPSLLSSGS